ncbi:hypothetical protein ACH5RR_001218 [Cinchona calisaya]|uniref:Uncharacterized protein n=1 Tax=Cinchona calisaya TaxID=153742 RepID=A0ABD3B3Y7_9GENT
MQGLTHEAFGNINSTGAIHGIEEDFDFGLELENDGVCDEETTNFFKLSKHTEAKFYKGYKSFTFISFLYRDKEGTRPQLKSDKVYVPPMCFTMSRDEKDTFCQVEKLETSSNGKDYHKEVSYLAAGPDKVKEGVDRVTLDALTPKSSTNIIEYGDDGDDFIEDDDYFSSEDDLRSDNTNGDTSGDDDDFIDKFQQGDEDDN